MEKTNNRLKVLLLTACTGRGGAGNSLYYICKYLDRDRIEPLVVMPTDGLIGEKLRALDVPTILAPRLRERFYELRFSRATPLTTGLSTLRNAWDSLVFTFQLAGIVRREDVDLIYCNHMMVKIIGILAGLLARVPVVLHTRTIYGNRAEQYLYLSFARLSHVKRIIAVSRVSAENFAPISEKVEVVRNGVPLDEISAGPEEGTLRKELGLDDSARIVGFIGRLVEWKGIDVFLQAAREVLKKRDDTVFVIMGDVPVGSTHGTLDDYRRRAREGGLGDRLIFTGFKSEAAALVSELDVLVVPSIRPDPCPRVVLEGLARGTPVIGSAAGGITEAIQDGETGLLVEPGNVAELVMQLERVLDDRVLADRIAEQGRAAARQHFSAEDVSRRIQDIFWAAAVPPGPGDSSTGGA